MLPHQTLELKPQCGLPPTQDPAEPRLNAHFIRLSLLLSGTTTYGRKLVLGGLSEISFARKADCGLLRSREQDRSIEPE